MRLLKLSLMAGLLSCCTAWPAFSQHTDESFTTKSEDCAGVQWSAETLKKYPNIVPACQSVEHHNGVEYVKFSGTVVRTKNGGKTLTLRLKDGGEVTVDMPDQTALSMEGRSTPMQQLKRGDQLNFYIPQNRVVAQFYAPEQKAEEAPAVAAPIESPPERVASTALPATASDVPLLATSGFLLLCLGAALTVFRRNRL
jgi:LPXTG-motif cell wall-anchored protein